MQYGTHLPLIDFDGRGWQQTALSDYARRAAGLGFAALAANDHLVFRRPWLDGTAALASVVEASGELILATTAALPVVRGAVAVAGYASALDALSGGRLQLGVAPGSSRADYDLAGVDFGERWTRFDQAVATLRRRRPDKPIWVASWGSPVGLRRVARLGDGWLASAYNTTPALVGAGRVRLRREQQRLGLAERRLPCTLATMWLHVTDSAAARETTLDGLAELLDRPRDALAAALPIGPPEHCADVVRAYAAAGVDLLCVWPVVEPARQIERFMIDVVPRV